MTEFETLPADWLSVDDAVSRILDRAHALPTVELPLEDALGHALAAPVHAEATLPPWDNSAMDGYAVRAQDVRGASVEEPVSLQVTTEVRAGTMSARSVGPGEAIRIMTGAPVPPGADSVVRVEHTDAEETPGRVWVYDDGDAHRNVRPRGEDMRPGDLVVDAGTTLGAGQIGVLAALGVTKVPVHERPRVALLANGDELAPLDRFEDVRAGRAVPESNTHAIAAAIREIGGLATRLGIALDTEESVAAHLEAALASPADTLLTLAGASMGETDLFKRVLDRMGFRLDFWRVRMRPGSPFSFGLLPRGDDRPALPVFGLPGNPASAFVTFHLLVRPFLLAQAGHRRVLAPVLSVVAGSTLNAAPHLAQFVRVRLVGERSSLRAVKTQPQGSGLVRSMVDADGLAVVPEGVRTVQEGESVDVVLLGSARGWSGEVGDFG
jgi:molybdopterin molybdotransferase